MAQIKISLLLVALTLSGLSKAADDPKVISKDIPSLPKAQPDVADEITDKKSATISSSSGPVFLNSGFFADNDQNRGLARSLNALELAGYFRTRFQYFRNPHLGTFIPSKMSGTSNMAPNLGQQNSELSDHNTSQNNFSGNMRLRLEPTIHLAETVRIKSAFDIFDNLVLGSTPSYMSTGSPSPSSPVSAMSMSQSAPIYGVNTLSNVIAVKRLWGEAEFPIGELRFGRMPMHWGLGLLYHSGDQITSDYGDQIDGIAFSTRVWEFFLNSGYSIAYVGPVGRGGGNASAIQFNSRFSPTEEGARYPLEGRDLTHVFMLSLLKRDSDFIAQQKLHNQRALFDYGLFTSYRRQSFDSQNYSVESTKVENQINRIVKRDANVGLASWWSSFRYGTFGIEGELAGAWGKYQIGAKDTDLLALRDDKSTLSKQDVWLLQGGAAIESKYGFLDDKLQVGVDAGFASYQASPGLGLREGVRNNPGEGDIDGRKHSGGSGYASNFKFNKAYTIDLLLHKEILGQVSGSFYAKPHLSYFFSRNFGIRGDVMAALAGSDKSVPGSSRFLGLEVDAAAFLKTQNGFYFNLAYGILFPFKGLGYRVTSSTQTTEYRHFGDARTAQTLQFYFGLLF